MFIIILYVYEVYQCGGRYDVSDKNNTRKVLSAFGNSRRKNLARSLTASLLAYDINAILERTVGGGWPIFFSTRFVNFIYSIYMFICHHCSAVLKLLVRDLQSSTDSVCIVFLRCTLCSVNTFFVNISRPGLTPLKHDNIMRVL